MNARIDGLSSNMQGDGLLRQGGDTSDWGKKSHFHKVDPTLADLSIHDLLERGNLGFNAIKVPVAVFNPFTQAYEPSGDYHIYRDDFTGGKLSDKTVAEGYTVVQYAEALEFILGDLRELGGVPTRVLSLNGGSRALVQLQLPGEYFVKDKLHKLFTNIWGDHSGRFGVGGNSCDVRAICENTVSMNWRSDVMRFFTKHTKNVGQRLVDMGKAVGIIRKQYQTHIDTLNLWAGITVTGEEISQFTHALIPDPKKTEGQRENNGPATRRNDLTVKVVSGIGQTPVPTAYSLFNAVTEQVDYRTQNRDETGQLAYALFGSGAALKEQAYSWLTEKFGEAKER